MKNRGRRMVLTGGIIGAIIVLLGIIFYYIIHRRKKHKTKQRLDAENHRWD